MAEPFNIDALQERFKAALPQQRPEVEEEIPTTPVEGAAPLSITVRPKGVEPPVQPSPDADPLAPSVGDPFSRLIEMRKRFEDAASLEGIRAQSPPVMEAVTNFSRGFNNRFAQLLGIPLGLLDRGLRLAGASVVEEGKDPVQAVKDAFKIVGIQTDAPDAFIAKFGAGTFDAMVMLAGLYAAAPTMAAAQGTSIPVVLARELGQFTQRFPGITAASELGATAGGIAGEEATGSPRGAFPGALIGSIFGAQAGGLVRRTFQVAQRGDEAIRAAISHVEEMAGIRTPAVTAPRPAITDAIRPLTGDPETTRAFAIRSVEGGLAEVEDLVMQAIKRVPSTGSAAQAQARTRALMDRALRAARRVEGKYWGQVNTKERVPTVDLKNYVTSLKGALKDTPGDAPKDFITRMVGGLVGKKKIPAEFAETASIRQLLSFRGELRRARWIDRASVAPNQAYQNNLLKLENAILDSIQTARPNDASIMQAREFSRELNDMFTRGPVADVMAMRAKGDPRVHPSETVEELMKLPEGVDVLPRISQWLRGKATISKSLSGDPRRPQRREIAVLDKMIREAEGAIRNMMHEAISAAEPSRAGEVARRWIANNRDAIRGLARVSAELDATSAELTQLASRQDAINRSAFMRFIKNDAGTVINRLFTSPDPATDAKSIMKAVEADADAMAGFRAGVMDKLLKQTGGSPTKILDFINEPKTRKMIEAVLSSDQLDRLRRITTVAKKLEDGDEKALSIQALAPTVLFARIIGAQIGRTIARALGGGTVQTPGIVADSAKKMAMRALDKELPDTLLSRAILSPHWEKMLLARDPSSSREIRDLTKRMRRVIGFIEGGKQHQFDTLPEYDDED